MNEEEILKECNELSENKYHELGDCWDEAYSANAIKGLLDLYNQAKQELQQEKEKNKKLEVKKMKLTKKELNEFPIGTKLVGEAYSYIKLLHDIWAKDYPPNATRYYDTAELVKDYKIEKVEIPTYTKYIPPKPILDDKEKEYLNNLIKPFRNEIKCIGKWNDSYRGEYIYFTCVGAGNSFSLPYFKAGTMYKGMELDKQYTLEELGL